MPNSTDATTFFTEDLLARWVSNNILTTYILFLGPFHGAIAVPSVTYCRCRRGHRCAGGVRQYSGDTWWIGVRRLVVANGPNIFQMLLVLNIFIFRIPSAETLSKNINILSVHICTKHSLLLNIIHNLITFCSQIFIQWQKYLSKTNNDEKSVTDTWTKISWQL